MNIRRAITAAAIGLVLTAASVPAQASVLFKSISDLGASPTSNAWCSTCDGSYQAYDAFSLSHASTIGQVHFTVQTNYGVFGAGGPLTLAFFSANENLAGTQRFSQSFTSANWTSTNTAFNTSILTLNPAGLSLSAGSYFISWFSQAGLGDPGYAGGSGLEYQSPAVGNTSLFSRNGDSLGFELDGVASGVPEPATWAFFLLGFGAIGTLMRMKRRSIAPSVA